MSETEELRMVPLYDVERKGTNVIGTCRQCENYTVTKMAFAAVEDAIQAHLKKCKPPKPRAWSFDDPDGAWMGDYEFTRTGVKTIKKRRITFGRFTCRHCGTELNGMEEQTRKDMQRHVSSAHLQLDTSTLLEDIRKAPKVDYSQPPPF